jgi:hypothetical protein
MCMHLRQIDKRCRWQRKDMGIRFTADEATVDENNAKK